MKDISEVPNSVVDEYLEAQARLEQKIRCATNAQMARDAIERHRNRKLWDKVLLVAAVLTLLALAVSWVMGW